MLQISLATASPAVAAPRTKPIVAAGVSGFAVALATAATALVPGATAEPGEALLPGRQALAAGGKKLPGLAEKLADGDGDKDAEQQPDASDAAFAWFAAPVVAEPVRTGFSKAAKPELRPITLGSSPTAKPAGLTLPVDGANPSTPTTAAPVSAPVVPGGNTAQPGTETSASVQHSTGDAADPKASAPAPASTMATDDAIVIPLATTPQPATPPVAVTPAVTLTPAGTIEIKPEFVAKADAATPPVPAQPVATPAVEISLNAPTLASRPALAATLAIAIDGPAAPRRLIREIAGATFAPTAPDSPSAPAVAATADMQQAALDTRRQEWMGSMIDRIETMRDASSTGDTRIRLSPEALGPVDISIRHEGDKIHVHFATETSAARQLLTDAQPRLAEIAEARGVKLGQTSVDGGNAGAGAGQQQAAAQQQTLSNRPASALSDDGAIDADQRIA